MSRIISLLALLIICNSCASKKQKVYSYESENLKIKQLSDNVFMHISYLKTDDFGKVACNGMVYINKNEAIVFDTPTDNKASKELITWITANQEKEIKAVVVTHYHTDCLGGLQEFHEIGATSYATKQTIALAKENKVETLPEQVFDDKLSLKIGRQPVYAQYFGAGHTPDNIVGYIPEEKTLFGGCLIKAVKASKGYLGDANVTVWPKTVAEIKSSFPDLETVIPGHGKSGGTELLDYTITLFSK